MEKLSLDKFSDKKLKNMRVIQGGEEVQTTWSEPCKKGGSDVMYDNGLVVCDDGMVFP